MTIRRRNVLAAVGGIVTIYLLSFVCTFQLLSDPVRSERGEWLGPAKRFNPEITDIGKIYVYNGTSMFVYRLYCPLCIVWLRVMGLP